MNALLGLKLRFGRPSVSELQLIRFRMTRTSLERWPRNLVESITLVLYFVLTVYLLPTHAKPSVGLMLYEAVRPFQIRARARNVGAEQNALVWSLSQSNARLRRLADAKSRSPIQSGLAD